MIELAHTQVMAERMVRQRLIEPVETHENEEEYKSLFRRLQPVSPVHNTRPGDPPRLVHRTRFDDGLLTGEWRERSDIVKGRFCGGRIGYVLQEDLALYAAAFCKPLTWPQPIHEEILDSIRNAGGLSKEQLKQELSEYKSGEMTKALQSLQEAFLIYEHQPDSDWDTGWFDFAEEWFEVKTEGGRRIEAVAMVIHRFVTAMVFATTAEIKSWSGLPLRTIRQALAILQEGGQIKEAAIVCQGQGYIAAEETIDEWAAETPSSVFMLDKSDFLVRAHIDELKQQNQGREVLQYMLIDGTFQGAVLGHWRIGPYDVDDIRLDLPPKETKRRMPEILDAVRKIYPPDRHAILKVQGQPLRKGV